MPSKISPRLRKFVDRAFAPNNGVTDLLFIHPPATIADRYGKQDVGDAGGDLPPLGVSYCAAYLRELGYGVGVLDCCALGATIDEVIHIIREKDPRCLGITSTTYALPTAIKLSDRIRKEFPDKVILLGGSHANAVPADALEHYSCFDVVVYGEGEVTSKVLIDELRKKGWDREAFLHDYDALGAIQGIVYKQGGRVIKTAERPVIADLDTLPLPARDLLPVEKYIPLPNQYRRTPIAHMVVIRGCPYVCTFCDQSNTKARTASPKRAVEEIVSLVENFGVREISFWDDTMTYNKKWITEFCDRLIAAKAGVIWSCFAAIRNMSPDVLGKMREAGCWNIFYGIETCHPELMKNIHADRKNVSADHIRQVVRWTKEAGIEVRGSFMFALPGETPEMARENIQFAIDLDCEYAQFSITTPFPGTKLYDDIKAGKWGKFTTLDFSQFQIWNVVFLPEGYKSKEEVLEISREAFRRFYFRPKYIAKKLLALRTFEDLKRYFKGFIFVFRGFAYGPAPDNIRVLSKRHPQETPPSETPAFRA